MSADVLPWLRESPQRSALERFWRCRQQMMESLSCLIESDTPTAEIETELLGTINAIETRARLVGLLAPPERVVQHHDWLPATPIPEPCRETYGEIFRSWTDRCLHKILGPRMPENTDA